MIVDDDCSADHFMDGKAVRQKHREGNAVVSKQWRKVAGMVRMITAPWIVVGHGVGKRIVHIAPAVGSFVDVEPKNPFLTGVLRQRQAVNLSPDDHAFVGLVKAHYPQNFRTAFTACYSSCRLRSATQDREKMDSRISAG